MIFHKFHHFPLLLATIAALIFPLSLLSGAEFIVSDAAGLVNALQSIDSNSDADNTIILNNDFAVSDSQIFVDHVTRNRRIFITSATGVEVIKFDNGLDLPENVNLVFATPGSTNSAVTGNATIVEGALEVRNGTQIGTGAGLYLGQTADTFASVVVAGKGSTLNVSGSDTAITALDGNASVLVSNQGILTIASGGELKLNGQVAFGHGTLLMNTNGSSQSLLSAGDDGWIRFENGSTLAGSGKLIAKNGVHVNTGSTIRSDSVQDVLDIDGGLWLDSTATVRTLGNANGESGVIHVTNGPTALQGTFILDLVPEYYGTAPKNYAILTSADGYSGDFQYQLVQDRYGEIKKSTISTTTDLLVTFTPYDDPHARITRTWNEWSVGNTLDDIYRSNNTAWHDFFADVMGMSDAQARGLFNQLSGEIYADMLMSMPSTYMARFAMDRVSWDSQHGHVFFGPQYRLAARSNNRAVWAQFLYDHNKIDSDRNAFDYTTDRYGIVGGVDQTLVGGKTAVGLILGYSNPELKRHGDKATADDYMIGLYGATRLFEAVELKLWGGVGKQYYDVTRQAYEKRLSSSPEGTNVTTSVEIAVPLYNGGPLVVKPVLGYDYQHAKLNGYTESGDALIAVSGGKTSLDRHIGRIGLMGEIGGQYANVYGGAQYRHLLGGDKYATVGHQFVGGGPLFQIDGVNLGNYSVMGNIGLQITLDDERTRMIFGDYTGDFGSQHTQHTGTIGFQQTF